jgi:hypothetical protein
VRLCPLPVEFGLSDETAVLQPGEVGEALAEHRGMNDADTARPSQALRGGKPRSRLESAVGRSQQGERLEP